MTNIQLETPSAVNALNWIISILNKHNITYQITGGLAAKVYGATRPLADIDIDVSNAAIESILSDVKPFIVYGPMRYQDELWDILLLTLDYHGQLIDFSGADDGLVFNSQLTKWKKCEVNFSAAVKKKINNLTVSIIDKNELIKYKSELKREVDLLDVEALTGAKLDQ